MQMHSETHPAKQSAVVVTGRHGPVARPDARWLHCADRAAKLQINGLQIHATICLIEVNVLAMYSSLVATKSCLHRWLFIKVVDCCRAGQSECGAAAEDSDGPKHICR